MIPKKQRINIAVEALVANLQLEDKKAIKSSYRMLIRETTFCKNQKMLLNY